MDSEQYLERKARTVIDPVTPVVFVDTAVDMIHVFPILQYGITTQYKCRLLEDTHFQAQQACEQDQKGSEISITKNIFKNWTRRHGIADIIGIKKMYFKKCDE